MPPKRKDAAAEGLPRPPGAHKRGKRIMTLLQQHHATEDEPLSTPERTPPPPPHRPQLAGPALTASTALFAAAFASPAPAPPSPHACLLSVPGLTRPALDDAIGTFFASIGQTYQLSQSERVFSQRVSALLYDVAGLPPPPELAGVPAVSELLALAVAALGAPLSANPHLAPSLYARCLELTADEDALARGGIDAVEAVNLLAERVTKPRHAAHPLRLDPLGKGFAVDLALYHNLHIPPAPTHPEYTRRQTLFWTVWKFDAIRSSSASTSFRLAEANVGWPLPPGADSDVQFGIARVARKICAKLLSARAKTEGLQAADVDTALADLEDLGLGVGVGLDISAILDAAAHGTPQHAAYLVSTYNWMYLVVWIAVRDGAGALPSATVAAVNDAAMRATERMAELARTVAARQLLMLAPRAVRDQLAAFVLSLVRLMVEGAVSSASVAAQYMALAETMIAAVRSASAYPETAMLANVLNDAVHRAVATLRLDASPGPAPAPHAPSGPSYEQGWSTVAVPSPTAHRDALVPLPPLPPVEQAPEAQADDPAADADAFTLDQELLDFLSGCGIEIPFFT
ncbi:hypothetical protein Q8F55_008467 [Vanrija albida]|uniref:Transcription factor domain-containing protein n=1 Tax=Vanrija albida TaxID=181172 RepID=A0ABR3PQW8_9TREE